MKSEIPVLPGFSAFLLLFWYLMHFSPFSLFAWFPSALRSIWILSQCASWRMVCLNCLWRRTKHTREIISRVKLLHSHFRATFAQGLKDIIQAKKKKNLPVAAGPQMLSEPSKIHSCGVRFLLLGTIPFGMSDCLLNWWLRMKS